MIRRETFMKITASKRDDILKRKAEYEADYAARESRYNAQKDAYYAAEDSITDSIEAEVMSQLKQFDLLEFQVSAGRNYRNCGVRIRILCNENTKFKDTVALAWSYNVSLNEEGQVLKESSSWSGLKATTVEQMESLVQTVEALKYLNSVDWAVVLNKDLSKLKDYITEDNPAYDRNKPNFDRELLEADVEDLIGEPVLVKGLASPASGYRSGVPVYYMIHKATPKQYEVSSVWVDSIDDIIQQSGKSAGIQIVKDSSMYRISKDKLFDLLKTPIETIQ